MNNFKEEFEKYTRSVRFNSVCPSLLDRIGTRNHSMQLTTLYNTITAQS